MKVGSDINKKLEIRKGGLDKPTRWKISSSLITKLSTFIFQLSTLFLTSCSELLYLNIEQMLPPEVMLEQRVNSIGIVNNFNQNNVVVVNEDAIILPCDADSVKEQVALTFADAGIMERVVVLDSLLYHPDSTTTHVFTSTEVNDLCQQLEVEMIYSIDYACLIYHPAARFISRPLNAYLCSRIYTPDRDSISGISILDKGTIDCWIDNANEIDHIIPHIPSMLAEASIKPYLPSWKERERVFYYDRLCYALREAKVYVYEGNWEAAGREWETLIASKIRYIRFMAAYNLALYYEMTDRIDEALTSLDQAEEFAIKRRKKDNTTIQIFDTTLLEKYREVLNERKKELDLLETWHHNEAYTNVQ